MPLHDHAACPAICLMSEKSKTLDCSRGERRGAKKTDKNDKNVKGCAI